MLDDSIILAFFDDGQEESIAEHGVGEKIHPTRGSVVGERPCTMLEALSRGKANELCCTGGRMGLPASDCVPQLQGGDDGYHEGGS